MIFLSIIFIFVFSFGNPTIIKNVSASVTAPQIIADSELASVLGNVYYVVSSGGSDSYDGLYPAYASGTEGP